MTDSPWVSVLVPARNEAADIGRALDAIAAQDYPHDRLEVVVVDGGSTDDTARVVEDFFATTDLGRTAVVSNPAGTTPSNLNAGLDVCAGEVLCRVDARSIIPTDYVSTCARVLTERTEVRVVGGAQVAVPRDASAVAVGITRALNNRWGMGLARYRRGAASGPADTVYLGAFRTAELREAGGWDERFTTNQDFELNRRMAADGLIWFESSLAVDYLPRADIGALFTQYERFGSWKVRYWRDTGDRPQPRQVLVLSVPIVGLFGLVVLARVPRWLRRILLIKAGAGIVLLELKGPTGPPAATATAHVVGIAASLTVAAGWTAGAWRAILTRPS